MTCACIPIEQVMVLDVPDDWITLHDAELLMTGDRFR